MRIINPSDLSVKKSRIHLHMDSVTPSPRSLSHYLFVMMLLKAELKSINNTRACVAVSSRCCECREKQHLQQTCCVYVVFQSLYSVLVALETWRSNMAAPMEEDSPLWRNQEAHSMVTKTQPLLFSLDHTRTPYLWILHSFWQVLVAAQFYTLHL